jgi:hypothetical protein
LIFGPILVPALNKLSLFPVTWQVQSGSYDAVLFGFLSPRGFSFRPFLN